MNRQWRLAIHCACAHDMSIRQIQVEVTPYLGEKPIPEAVMSKRLILFCRQDRGVIWCRLSLHIDTHVAHIITSFKVTLRVTSSERWRPTAVTGGAIKQYPACGAREAGRRAWSSALIAGSCKVTHAFFVQRQLSHSLWR